jgi:hypothetical protein
LRSHHRPIDFAEELLLVRLEDKFTDLQVVGYNALISGNTGNNKKDKLNIEILYDNLNKSRKDASDLL